MDTIASTKPPSSAQRDGSDRQIIDVSAIVEEQTIGWFAVKLMGLVFAAMLFAGFDFAGISFVVPYLVKAWQVPPSVFGSAFGIGLFGMMLGSLFFGYVGDKVGRKSTLIVGCWLFGMFTLASAWAESVPVLAIERFVAGVGFYAVIPNGIVLVSEFAPKRLKATWAVIAFIGFSVGTAIAGFVAAVVIPAYGWQSMFVIGGIGPLLVSFFIISMLSESARFLALKKERWGRLGTIVAAMKPGTIVAADAQFTVRQEANQDTAFTPKLLFEGPLLLMTPLAWLFYIFNSMAVFFMTSWLPVLIQSVGLTPTQAALTTGVYGAGGIAGGLLAGWLIDHYGMLLIAIIPTIGAVVSALLGYSTSEIALMVTAFMSGFFVVGTQNAIMTITPTIYPTSFRAKGQGTAIAVAKIGAIAGPVIGGHLMAAHVPASELFYAASLTVLVGAVFAYPFAFLYLRNFGIPGEEMRRPHPAVDRRR
jgi:AAHS family 4-hydroxybenzoate transporter-like MFS transporter